MISQKGGQAGKGRHVSQDREGCGSLSRLVMQATQGRAGRQDREVWYSGSTGRQARPSMAGLSVQVSRPGRQVGTQQAGAREGRQDRQVCQAFQVRQAGRIEQRRQASLGWVG